MANRQTTRLRKLGLSLRFNKGVDFSKERRGPDLNPEFSVIQMVLNPRKRKLGSTRHAPTFSMRDQAQKFYCGIAA